MENEYFNEDLENEIRLMTTEEMYSELARIEKTPVWTAILKYNGIRMSYAQQAINSTDPVKEPTFLARNQGILIGLTDLQNTVISLVEEKKDLVNNNVE